MIKISEILKDYKIEKKDLLILLKKYTGKEYSDKVRVIGESTFKKIELSLNKNSKKELISKDSSEQKKTIKIDNDIKGKKEVKHTVKKKKNDVKKNNKDHKSITSHDIQGMDFLANTLGIKSDEQKVFAKKKTIKKKQPIEETKIKVNTSNDKKQNIEKSSFKIRKKGDITLESKNKIEQTTNKTSKVGTSGGALSNFRVQKKGPKTRNDFKKLRQQEQERNRELAKNAKKIKKPKVSDTLKKKDKIIMQDNITVKELSERVGIASNEIIKTFILNGMPVGINSSVDFDTVSLLSDDLGIKVEKENVTSDIKSLFEGKFKDIIEEKNALSDDLLPRYPIVTIMGHVDHGKTKLLDYLRKSDVVGKESGGITQGIGASQITHEGRKITFIDTPGHELFTSMRARGAKVTDIAVIVVAADEGVKQQTIEAIDHAKAAGVVIMVAITKIDKPNINIDLVKSQLSEHELTPEDWGGQISFVELSSITGEGVDEFLEMINLQADMLELKYNPKAPAVGIILEASKDAKMGTIATILPITGTLYKKDAVVAYDVYGRMKMMKDWTGKIVKEVSGGSPVQVMGFEGVPESGRIFEVFDSEKEAQKQVSKMKDLIRKNENKTVLSSFLEKMKAGEKVEMNIILKAGDFGGLEALKYAIGKVNIPEGIDLKVIHEEVGQIKETDISLAEASGAFIFGFDSSIQSTLKKKLEQKKIIFKNFTIIYELLDYIELLASGMIKKEAEEIKIGEFEMLAMFFKKGNDMIIGGKVKSGKIVNGAHFIIKRGDEELGGGRITSLKIDQENVNEVKEGRECGLRVRTGKRFKEGDILEIFITE